MATLQYEMTAVANTISTLQHAMAIAAITMISIQYEIAITFLAGSGYVIFVWLKCYEDLKIDQN